MRTLFRRLIALLREDPGQDLVEYSLLIAFLAMAAVAVLSQVGTSIQGPWDSAGTTLAAAGGAGTSSSTADTPPPDNGDHGNPGHGGGDHGDGDHGDGRH